MTTREEELLAVARLLRNHRWGALATVEADGQPYASAVAFAAEKDLGGILLHLSQLAPHTRNLLATPHASLLVTEPDAAGVDPQTLPRVSLLGRVEIVPREAPEFAAARQCYLARLPDAAPLFDFGDFLLLRMAPTEVRFVGGFARARRFDGAALREAAGLYPAAAD